MTGPFHWQPHKHSVDVSSVTHSEGLPAFVAPGSFLTASFCVRARPLHTSAQISRFSHPTSAPVRLRLGMLHHDKPIEAGAMCSCPVRTVYTRLLHPQAGKLSQSVSCSPSAARLLQLTRGFSVPGERGAAGSRLESLNLSLGGIDLVSDSVLNLRAPASISRNETASRDPAARYFHGRRAAGACHCASNRRWG